MSSRKNKLTPKQEKFCRIYLEKGNATEAYRQAYSCEKMKDATISRRAFDLLENSKIKAYIEREGEAMRKVHMIEKERILYQLEAIMEANIADYLEFDGIKVSFKPFKDLTVKQLNAIEGIKQNKDGEVELKLHGKSWTIDRIVKILGYEAPKKIDHTSGGDKITTNKVIILPSNNRDA